MPICRAGVCRKAPHEFFTRKRANARWHEGDPQPNVPSFAPKQLLTGPMDAEKVTLESAGVYGYLTILQSVIARMGTNSSNCKNWCVALVSAIVVVVADRGKPDY